MRANMVRIARSRSPFALPVSHDASSAVTCSDRVPGWRRSWCRGAVRAAGRPGPGATGENRSAGIAQWVHESADRERGGFTVTGQPALSPLPRRTSTGAPQADRHPPVP
jgi:hypothetical protein